MKLENLVFSLIAVFVAIVILAILGWGLSFVIAKDISLKESFSGGDARLFFARVVIGTCFMGIVNGAMKLWDLFVFCMTEAPLNKD